MTMNGLPPMKLIKKRVGFWENLTLFFCGVMLASLVLVIIFMVAGVKTVSVGFACFPIGSFLLALFSIKKMETWVDLMNKRETESIAFMLMKEDVPPVDIWKIEQEVEAALNIDGRMREL
jgi:hypothetical protein